MAIIVQKYGGTSVADTERIKNVARRIAELRDHEDSVVVVVSASGDTTDKLMEQALAVSEKPPRRELDMLLATGEQVSIALLAMAVQELGFEAISLTGAQVGIVTDTSHTKARILDVDSRRVVEALDEGKVVIVAGFQGVTVNHDITTLGRGGSDTTAVALAAKLGAKVCQIFTDVEGVYTADPRIVPEARLLEMISYDEMLEMSSTGAKVLQLRAVEYARKYNVPVEVRSSFKDVPGTLIREENESMEAAIISGVSSDASEAKVTIFGVPDQPGVAAKVFRALAEHNINVDMILQNVSEAGKTDISFTVPEADLPTAGQILDAILKELGATRTSYDREIGKVTLVGAGMRSHPGVAALMFETLAGEGINIEMISTSSIKISCIVQRDQLEKAVRALHESFDLAGNTAIV